MNFVFEKVVCFYGLFDYPITIYQNKNKHILSIGCKNFVSLADAVEEAKKRNIYCDKTHEIIKLILMV